ncbi:MAG: hypothetical protein J5J00_01205, partial [Deltaproteobacteria bacterium]|nr:hypothetical protein [Deltaproteobacteria bacterium]
LMSRFLLRKSQLAASLVECSLLLALIIMIATPAISFLSFSTNRMFCGMVAHDDPAVGKAHYKAGKDGSLHCWVWHSNPFNSSSNPNLYYF